jgi:glycosyltransferase involved in cell wall biosynthesis
MIATPTYDGRLDAYYVNSLTNTLQEARERGITVVPIYITNDALIQRARNDLMAIAYKNDFDDVIFIDSDIEWEPMWFFKLLKYNKDVVGGTYRKKNDTNELYVIKALPNNVNIVDGPTGLIKVSGLGTGFLRLNRKAIAHLWNTSAEYNDDTNNKFRMIFDITILDGKLQSEDINMCQKLINGGFDIWLDPRMCCNHIGTKKYEGNFINWYTKIIEYGAACSN